MMTVPKRAGEGVGHMQFDAGQVVSVFLYQLLTRVSHVPLTRVLITRLCHVHT